MPQAGRPCLTVADQGEGQTPDTFPDTFMSIQRNNKLRIPFVQGKFNMGELVSSSSARCNSSCRGATPRFCRTTARTVIENGDSRLCVVSSLPAGRGARCFATPRPGRGSRHRAWRRALVRGGRVADIPGVRRAGAGRVPSAFRLWVTDQALRVRLAGHEVQHRLLGATVCSGGLTSVSLSWRCQSASSSAGRSTRGITGASPRTRSAWSRA